MPTFPVPNLANAYRPSFFEGALSNVNYLAQYKRVLRETFPKRYRTLKRRTPRACYLALYEECAKRFPMYEMPYMDAQEVDGADFANEIPYEVLGIDPYEEQIYSPAVALIFIYWYRATKADERDYPGGTFDCFKDYYKELPAWLPDTPKYLLKTYLTPGRRRRWKTPWNYLYDLVVRVTGQTDNPFIDTTVQIQHESAMFPAWDREEIRALAKYCRRAKPIVQNAAKLVTYVDERPRERLPLLAGALRRDAGTLQQLTTTSRTLAEVYGLGDPQVAADVFGEERS